MSKSESKIKITLEAALFSRKFSLTVFQIYENLPCREGRRFTKGYSTRVKINKNCRTDVSLFPVKSPFSEEMNFEICQAS